MEAGHYELSMTSMALNLVIWVQYSCQPNVEVLLFRVNFSFTHYVDLWMEPFCLFPTISRNLVILFRVLFLPLFYCCNTRIHFGYIYNFVSLVFSGGMYCKLEKSRMRKPISTWCSASTDKNSNVQTSPIKN